MKEVVEKLMDYGMDFEYEHHGSEGEKVVSYELGVEIQSYQGNLHFTFEGELEKMEDCKKSYAYIATQIEEICIEETSSF